MPSLSQIGDLSIITSCLVPPGFLMDTLLRAFFLISFLLAGQMRFVSFTGAILFRAGKVVQFTSLSPMSYVTDPSEGAVSFLAVLHAQISDL